LKRSLTAERATEAGGKAKARPAAGFGATWSSETVVHSVEVIASYPVAGSARPAGVRS
jgi:hypothetical protein